MQPIFILSLMMSISLYAMERTDALYIRASRLKNNVMTRLGFVKNRLHDAPVDIREMVTKEYGALQHYFNEDIFDPKHILNTKFIPYKEYEQIHNRCNVLEKIVGVRGIRLSTDCPDVVTKDKATEIISLPLLAESIIVQDHQRNTPPLLSSPTQTPEYPHTIKKPLPAYVYKVVMLGGFGVAGIIGGTLCYVIQHRKKQNSKQENVESILDTQEVTVID